MVTKGYTKELDRVVEIFKNTEGIIRPHFILTGPSGSGKSFTIAMLCEKNDVPLIEINAAQLTKEGTSGNSLSKALAPLKTYGDKPVVCFVDEWDKMFISGNTNDSSAHETTTGIQNEFLKVLESDITSVFGDYGKYVQISIKNVLFIFAGAFNNEEDITLDRLRELGVKTEFLGRVGLVYNTEKLTLDDMLEILGDSKLLHSYCQLFNTVPEDVVKLLKPYITKHYDNNTLGARMISTLVHQYFIKGGLEKEEVVKITFQKEMTL